MKQYMHACMYEHYNHVLHFHSHVHNVHKNITYIGLGRYIKHHNNYYKY